VTHILHHNPHRNLGSIRRLQRQYWTAFKHGTRRVRREQEVERDDETLLAASLTSRTMWPPVA
jgi:hypothetical protein